MPNVSFVRDEVRRQLNKWQLITDCIAGQNAIKSGETRYLPQPNPEDTSPENRRRYESYLLRALFYNATRRTLDGLVGQVFLRPPHKELSPKIENLDEDVDGAGVSLDQQSKQSLELVISHGRCGLLVDYPTTDQAVSLADQDAGYIRPTITLYRPESIINWRTTTVGAKRLLSLVVLQESYIKEDDGFEPTFEDQWRVLRLVGATSTNTGEYRVELWRENTDVPFSVVVPRDANGEPLNEIPFIFLGPRNNDEIVDDAPLYDLAVVNIAHYRNSADYEESCYLVGQPTPWFSGVTEKWVEDVWKGKVVLGSRSAVPLPENGLAGLLQVKENSQPFEAMGHKERQMVALGAKLVEQRDVQRTLGEAEIEQAAETSVLATAAKNVGLGYTTALKWCGRFAGDTEDTEIEYLLNTDFPAARMTADERAQLVAEWQSRAISFTEMRLQLKKAGVATLEDEQAASEAREDELLEMAEELEQANGAAAGSTSGSAEDEDNGEDNGRSSPTQNSKTT